MTSTASPDVDTVAAPTADPVLDLGSPTGGDVVELILADHVRFEALLRRLRDSSADRDAVRRALSTLHVAHAEAEERHVYPTLRTEHAIGAHEAEHGEEEHAEGNQALLDVLELTQLSGPRFDEAVEELSRVLAHHLTEEELTILNPARAEVPADVLERLGRAFATERDAQIRSDCGRRENVRALVARATEAGLLGEQSEHGEDGQH